jgi:hypothetical protein
VPQCADVGALAAAHIEVHQLPVLSIPVCTQTGWGKKVGKAKNAGWADDEQTVGGVRILPHSTHRPTCLS